MDKVWLASAIAVVLAACGANPPVTIPADAGSSADASCATKTTCKASSAECGTIDDGCGGKLVCPDTCALPMICGGGGEDTKCGCTPETDKAFCSRLGKNCDLFTSFDNCDKSRSVNCGLCDPPNTCGGGGKLNVCGQPGGCSPACGGATPVCNSGKCECNATSCPTGDTCLGGECVAKTCSPTCSNPTPDCINGSCECNATSCPASQSCIGGACSLTGCPLPCSGETPVCDGKKCVCGPSSCPTDYTCGADGACQAVVECKPTETKCAAACCTSFQFCHAGTVCQSCECAATPPLWECAPTGTTDSCGNACAVCGAGRVCDATSHKCFANCSPGCSGTTPDCVAGACVCNATSCAKGYSCTKGACVPCAPQCLNRSCGDDTCGGVCGVCTTGSCDQASGKCLQCQAGLKRCSADNLSVETCAADGSGWSAQSCPQPGACDPKTIACRATSCTPGSRKCTDALHVDVCAADGSTKVNKDCRTIDQFATSAAICQNDDCVDPCGQAGRSGSYMGCEFWAAVTSNAQLDATLFKAGAVDGTQSDTVGDFAVVVSNPGTVSAKVKVERKKAGAVAASPSDPAASADGITVQPATVTIIKLPWQQVAGTGDLPYGYHVTSDQPVAVYQFNPIDAYTDGKKEFTDPSDPTRCTNCAFTNDASLLIPAPLLGSGYVVVGQEHITLTGVSGSQFTCVTDADCGSNNTCIDFLGQKVCQNTPTFDIPAFFSVVAAEDNTLVTVRFAASTVASKNGTAIAAQAKNSTQSYTLGRFDVLQFATDADLANPLQCYTYPAGTSWGKVCRYSSDPTGSLILASDVTDPTKEKPVAVFSGADCSFKPYDQFACDHMEEMMVPFSNWGKSFVGVKSAPYLTSTGTPVTAPAPDYWRVVAGCGKQDCPGGTHLVITPAPTQILEPQYCQGNTCTLPPVDAAGGTPTAAWLEIAHAGDFTIEADQPVEVSQCFTGEEANTGSAVGDPSLLLAAPVEAWRTTYDVVTAPTFLYNYLSLAAQSSAAIQLDGKALSASNFPGLSSRTVGSFPVYVVPVSGGAHHLSSSARLGVSVYGYDSYVSYGYLGGLDLLTNVSYPPGR